MKRIREKIRNKIRQLKGDPKNVARSFALGSFMGVTPLVGMQILISISISWIFRMNRSAAIAGVINTNWTKGLLLYPVNFKIGSWLLGIEQSIDIKSIFSAHVIQNLLQAGPGVFFSLLMGGFITGAFLASIYYVVVLRILENKTIKTQYNESK